ncbi:MAG: hypothetical protein ACREBH_01360 [Candidatus Micrarchaeaceae archaeon]
MAITTKKRFVIGWGRDSRSKGKNKRKRNDYRALMRTIRNEEGNALDWFHGRRETDA